MKTYETSELFSDIANAAARNQKITGFPIKVMLAVWACESDWGTQLTGDFNYWGITCKPTDGPAKFCATHENITPAQLLTFPADERATAVKGRALSGGRFRYSMSRWFASYASLDESVLAYTEFFTKSPHRYQAAWQQFLIDRDEDALLKHICEAGYATGPAEDVELAIEHQANIAHAAEMAAKQTFA